MTTQYTMFPIKFNFNGLGFETKALKYAGKHEVLYKIALPSAVSDIQQCWISNNNEQWKLIMGAEADKNLVMALVTAIKTHEYVVAIYAEKEVKQGLKSA